MLRFYGYYKQATEGKCHLPKPAFWEVVKKAKWDAWTRLGNMSRTEAMNNYVEELKKIVETMSYTDNVANFLGSLDSFYESVPAEDLELLVGPVLERMRSQPGSPLSGSPLGSRSTSPHRVPNTTSRHITSSLETSPATSHSASPLPPDTDGEEEVYIDTVESTPEQIQKEISTNVNNSVEKSQNEKTSKEFVSKENHQEPSNGCLRGNINGHVEGITNAKQDRGRHRTKRDDQTTTEFYNQIVETLQHLQKDLDRVTGRVRSLEGQALSALAPSSTRSVNPRHPKWWPLSDCSPRMFTLIIVWPFAVQAMLFIAQRYRKRRL
ncbi:acyl-CoA-binding domain-containing protein 5-B isoform X2 [Prorops nasuta]